MTTCKIRMTIIIYILAFYTLHGQNLDEEQEFTNKNIHSAEMAIIDGDLDKAREYYDKIIDLDYFITTKDLLNILNVALELEDEDYFFQHINKLLGRNINNQEIIKEFGNRSIASDKKWQEFLNQNMLTDVKNPSMRITIDSMLDMDQKFRKREGAYSLFKDTIDYIDSTNMEVMFNYIINDNFPSEREIGVTILSGKVGWEVILTHYLQSTSLEQSKKERISTIIINLSREGKIPPNQSGYFIDLQNGEINSGCLKVFQLKGNNTIYYPKYTALQIKSMDDTRKLLLAESFEDYMAKVAYSVRNPDTKYRFDTHISIFEPDDSIIQIFENKFNKITFH